MIHSTGRDALVALFAGVAGVAGSYALTGNTPDFVGAPVAAFVITVTPPELIAFSIQTLGAVGDLLAFAFAQVLTICLLALVAFIGLVVGRLAGRIGAIGGVLLAAVLAWGIATVLTGAPVPALGSGFGVGVVVGIASLPVGKPVYDAERRRVLGSLVGALGIGIAGYLLGSRRPGRLRRLPTETPPKEHTNQTNRPEKRMPSKRTMPDMRTVEDLLGEARRKSLDVDSLPGLVSSIEEFYEVDISSLNPDVSKAEWSLSVTGNVEKELTLDYADLRSMSSVNVYKTLRCVGEQLNAHLMDNAVWTAVPLMDIIDRAKPTGNCDCVMLRAADDYYEEFPLAALETGLLAFGMNGFALPRNHGYPVRALIPGHWGEINVKWLAEIEVLDRSAEGFWEKRGWHGTGPVNTVAKLWVDNRLADGRRQVAGLAYAGTRGIERVEVSTDGGGTWNDARLSKPLRGEDVWRQWAYEWKPSGTHEVVVRAVDGEGNLQKKEKSRSYPNGASGWVSKTIPG
jgi:DMSO/TMAO reductase YedYZ molybdopterin-dependent catalytic subunit